MDPQMLSNWIPCMPKRSSNKRPAEDENPNVTAFNTVQQATAEDEPEAPPEKNPATVALGRLGGLKGGKARVCGPDPPERRSDIARKAAKARWKKS